MLNTLPMIIQPIALTVTLVYVTGLVAQWKVRPLVADLIYGGFFSIGVVASMSTPIVLGDGIIVDMRNLLVGAAVAFLGPIAGAMALFGGGITRFLIGGQGMVPGLLGMLLSAGMGLIWRAAVQPRLGLTNSSLIILGGMISVHIGLGLMLNSPYREAFFATVAPLVCAMNLVGAWLLGRLMEREKARLTELEQLQHEAHVDPLTNLLNRRKLSKAVRDLPRHPPKNEGRVVLCFDIDHFKAVNDEYGHAAGDAALQQLATRVRSALREGDLFSRIGGDEFVVVLPFATIETARVVAERCVALASDTPITGPQGRFPITISMGATWSDRMEGLEIMLERADEAMYSAKRKGRNRVVFNVPPQDDMPLAG